LEAKHKDPIDDANGSPLTVTEDPESGSVLVIDDDDTTLFLLQDLLDMHGFGVRAARNGHEGLEVFARSKIDLVITDIRMPQMDGMEVLMRVRARDDTVPVILVTGFGDLDNALKALREGAHDFLLKPIKPEIFLNAVKKGLELCRLKRFEKTHTEWLEREVDRKTKDLKGSYETIKKIQSASVFALARLAESRDGETGDHLKRIQRYCRALSERLANRAPYAAVMTEQFIEDLVQCCVLHDIGKVSVPDRVLFCRNAFTPEQRSEMMKHATRGGEALEQAAKEVGEDNNYLFLGRDVAWYHHERWDGSGYPKGLKGDQIPLAARIVAVADVYDALTSKRRYKVAYSHEQARETIREARGTHFDPEVVDAFLEIEAEFMRIRESIAGEDVLSEGIDQDDCVEPSCAM
jgi:putative two-component system response regulator